MLSLIFGRHTQSAGQCEPECGHDIFGPAYVDFPYGSNVSLTGAHVGWTGIPAFTELSQSADVTRFVECNTHSCRCPTPAGPCRESQHENDMSSCAEILQPASLRKKFSASRFDLGLLHYEKSFLIYEEEISNFHLP